MTSDLLLAQGRTIEGQVLSADSEEALPGVNITIKDGTGGTTSDAEGMFSLSVDSENRVLVFSFIGYEKQEITVGSSNFIEVSLRPSAQALSGVVVTALGVEREEKSLGYSVQEIEAENLADARETNFVNSLQGSVSGAQMVGSPGTMGGSSRILLRGINSISGSNQPLFIVDGVPIDNSNFNSALTQSGEGGAPDYGNAAQDINPSDIESISVLKGPNAAALYGSRAANGAILITTKSGEAREGIGIDFSSSIMVDRPYLFPNYQNSYGGGYVREFDVFEYDPTLHPSSYAEFDGHRMVDYSSDESWGPELDGQMVRPWHSWYPDNESFGQLEPFSANPDNIRNFFQDAAKLSNSISFYGGGENATYRASYTNLNQRGTLPNSGINRHNVALSGRLDLTDRLHVSSKINYISNRAEGRASVGDYSGTGRMGVMSSFNTWFQRQLEMDQLRDYQADDASFKHWNLSSPTNLDPFYWVSPYFEVYENTNNDSRERVYGFLSLSYDIRENLSITGWARTDFYDDRRERRVAVGHVNPSMYSQDIISKREDNLQVLTEYNNDYGDVTLGATLGGNIRNESLHHEQMETIGGLTVPNFYNIEASVDRPFLDDYEEEVLVYGVFGSTNIGYKETLFLDASLRNDWSSTLPVDNNSYLYPALSSSIVFTELLPMNKFLSYGKLRVGWAQVGNATDPYRLSGYYEPQTGYGSTPTFNVPDILNNSELKPEITTSTEIGTSLEFFSGSVELDATVYQTRSRNQIVDLAVSTTSGYSAAIINAGEIKNQGIEVSLNGFIITNPNGLNWNLKLNWARNQNEVVELAQGQENYQLVDASSGNGVSLNARVGEPYGTLIGDGVATNENGEKLIDENGLYVREPNKVLGNVLADFTGGVRNTFKVKGLRLSALVDYQVGGDIFSVTSATGIYAGLLEETVGFNDKGNPIRDPVSEGGGIKLEGVKQNGQANDVYVEAIDYFKNMFEGQHIYDASFIKLREVTINYTLPQRLLENLPMRDLSVGLVGRNLLILHKNIPHVDPETAMGSGNIQGYESAQLPTPRSIGFNIKTSF
ncbi:SusC/RagA family TonB-linked outer membrane protein [Halalkalibaculum sp. DA384]|uniref:SusC/RagA family TonB-linked outer membrane protein n=1 Tax=Halalkalibaculum sp. DA384 TaxID=3373606 RepID=UPI00375522CD